tara:strand:+ start:16 stop:498 length:483 start_codon:yes stop_codon:yes gene_type:complete
MNIGISMGSAAVSALLGRQIVSQAITDASSSIYSSIGDVFHHTHSIDKVLYSLDINNKVKTLELLCNSLPSKEIDSANENAIDFCLENLHDMILHIREDLAQIKKMIEYHKSKWFSSMRSLDVRVQLKNLDLHTKLLDSRYELFIKTLTVYDLLDNKLNV